ncbi:MAG: hypothetical protein AB8G11_26390 [Saprospiraceae bacterium]
MKILKKSLFTVLILTSLFSFTTTESSYVGKWKGQDKGEIGFLILDNDGYIKIEFEEQTIGGKSFYQNNVELSMKYVVNDFVFPSSIDLIIVRNSDDKELRRMKGIVSLESNDEMLIALNFDGTERPKDFLKDAITFNRVK